MDLRSSEDQGMDLTITDTGFDTKFPLNINEDDLHPHTKEMPPEREGLTDMTIPLVWFNQCRDMRHMYSMLTRSSDPLALEKLSGLLDELYNNLEQRYLRYSNHEITAQYLMLMGVTRIIVSKMTLVIYLPELFSSLNERISADLHAKLLVAAIEVAEFNHMLNASKACQPWRWIYQTYTHWHAIVYILLTAAQRPWTPTVQRGWAALHSKWLIPTQISKDRNLRTWVPLRKLMAKAKRHRETEMVRLQGDPEAARILEKEDYDFPQPVSSGMFQGQGDVAEMFRGQWRQLVGLQAHDTASFQSAEAPGASNWPAFDNQAGYGSVSGASAGDGGLGISDMDSNLNMAATAEASTFAGQEFDQEFSSWQWEESGMLESFSADVMGRVDFDMDLDGTMDWNKWLQEMRE
jgi:hypothetical protein